MVMMMTTQSDSFVAAWWWSQRRESSSSSRKRNPDDGMQQQRLWAASEAHAPHPQQQHTPPLSTKDWILSPFSFVVGVVSSFFCLLFLSPFFSLCCV
jgi:hypothetical protein